MHKIVTWVPQVNLECLKLLKLSENKIIISLIALKKVLNFKFFTFVTVLHPHNIFQSISYNQDILLYKSINLTPIH